MGNCTPPIPRSAHACISTSCSQHAVLHLQNKGQMCAAFPVEDEELVKESQATITILELFSGQL